MKLPFDLLDLIDDAVHSQVSHLAIPPHGEDLGLSGVQAGAIQTLIRTVQEEVRSRLAGYRPNYELHQCFNAGEGPTP